MTKVALYLAASLLVASAAACGGGAREEDAASILRQAHTAMSSLDSYQALVTGDGVGDQTYFTVDWQRPDSFHVIAAWEEREDDRAGQKQVSETIVIGDRAYGRQCKAGRADCSEWTEGERGDVDFPAPSPGFDPRWPIVSLELMVDAEITREGKVDGVPCIHVTGRVNALRAMYQSLEEGLRQRGVATYGQECTARPGEPEECRDVPIEEVMERQAEDIRSGDEFPSPVSLWIGRDDKLVRRYVLTHTLMEERFTYLRFNQVEIRPPE
jgi:hypothetical protein